MQRGIKLTLICRCECSQLYYKDTFSERIRSFHKKKRPTEQGSATRAEKLKTNEQVSPLQLLKGMTTST